jgi:hypothetical protein
LTNHSPPSPRLPQFAFANFAMTYRSARRPSKLFIIAGRLYDTDAILPSNVFARRPMTDEAISGRVDWWRRVYSPRLITHSRRNCHNVLLHSLSLHMYNIQRIEKYFPEKCFLFTKFGQPENFLPILCKKGLTYTKSVVSLYVEPWKRRWLYGGTR